MLQIKRLVDSAKLPTRGTPTSIGLDVYAHLLTDTGRPNTAIIPPRSTRLIDTGLAVRPPEGYAVFVCSRSGLAADRQRPLFVANAPGVVDPDYIGELKIILYNAGHESYYVKHEDRIAQLVILPCQVWEIEEVASLPPTLRGEAGFGSTGR